MADLSELIAKLKTAERGSRDLTADIYEALGYEVIRTPRHPNGIAWRYLNADDPQRWQVMEDLSESIDAAIKHLVPKGWIWDLHGPSDEFQPAAKLWNGLHGKECIELRADANTPELSLCIASLKARED